jgi:hypothetical protein
MAELLFCEKCRKTMAETNFYTYKSGQKCELCKPCVTMHINNFDPETFLWLLEKFDVPYIEAEWNVLRDRAFQKDPYKMNGMSVFGKYLSKMKLIQWKKYTWADTEMLQQEAEEKAKQIAENANQLKTTIENMKVAYENGEISEAQYKTYMQIQAPEPTYGQTGPAGYSAPNASPYPSNAHPFEQVDLVDLGADLTADDKIYLAMKWGRLYSASDWVTLEKLYTDFMNSFDIQGAARIDTLIMICKTSLKMNQAIDSGDIESYQKLSRVYDSMMKSAKFTEAQNKEDKGDYVDSCGELVAMCEKEGGFIPRFCTDIPQDKVDMTLRDLKEYTKKLIEQDSGLAQQIEQYMKKKNVEQERKEQEAKLEDDYEVSTIEDDDVEDFYNLLEEQRKQDAEFALIQGGGEFF